MMYKFNLPFLRIGVTTCWYALWLGLLQFFQWMCLDPTFLTLGLVWGQDYHPQWLFTSYQQESHMTVCRVITALTSHSVVFSHHHWSIVMVSVCGAISAWAFKMYSNGISASCYGQHCRDYESDADTRLLQHLHWKYRNRISQDFVPPLDNAPW